MKRISSMVLMVLLISLSISAFAANYDQSTIVATAGSFIQAMINGDSKGLRLLTKDIIPLYWSESGLLEYAMDEMEDTALDNYYYIRSGNNALFLYNRKHTPSPQMEDHICMRFAKGNNKYYITELNLPGYIWYDSYEWEKRYKELSQYSGESLGNALTSGTQGMNQQKNAGTNGKGDQSSPLAAAQSFIEAMLEGDSQAIQNMTKDVIPWYYLVSDLLEYSTDEMSGSSLSDFCFYQSEEHSIIAYDQRVTPSPGVMDYYCMDFVRADGKYYIHELHLPGHYRGLNSSIWEQRCKALQGSGALGSIATPEETPVPAIPKWQNAWESVKAKKQLIDLYLDDDPRYAFEAFVDEYRRSDYHRAWTAALSSLVIADEVPAALLNAIQGKGKDLSELFEKDAKIASLVIEYLAENDFADRFQAQEKMDVASEIFTIEGELHADLEFTAVSNIKVYSVKKNQQFKLSDVMCVTPDNYDKIYYNLKAARNPVDGTVDLTHPLLIGDMYIDAPSKLGDKVQEMLGRRIIEEHGADSFELKTNLSMGKKVLKGTEIFTYLIEPVFSGYGAYVEFKKYEAVLEQYENELRNILNCSQCKNTEKIVTKVMDALTDTVAEGIVLSIEKEVFTDVSIATGELLLDISCIPLAVVNIEGAILQLAADTSNTFGKVWSIEDLYEEYQNAEVVLRESVAAFYSSPSDATYTSMEANYQYYAMLVNTGTNAVSNVLISDAEAGVNKFKNWVGQVFSGSKADWRLEQIENAKAMPDTDRVQLDNVRRLIFGN